MDFSPVECEDCGLRITASDSVDVQEFVDWLRETGINESRIIVPESIRKEISARFPLNSELRAVSESRDIRIRTTSSSLPTAVVSTERQYLGVEFGSVHRLFEVADSDFKPEFASTFDELFETGTPLEIDVPPWDELLDQLEEMVGPATRQEYVRLIDAARANDIESVDEISVALIATALAGGLLYDIGKWGEDTGVGSKASFSRRKTALEEDGVIVTEKVPVDVGRPRLRLLLSDRVGRLSMDIGVDSRDIDGSEPIGTDEQSETSRRSGQSEAKRPTQDHPEPGRGRSDDFIAQLDEELQELLSSDSDSG